jgi:PAS domain-containing protein
MKEIFAVLPEEGFENINRGIIVATKYIANTANGVYTMTDGSEFKRRVRPDRIPKKHKVLNGSGAEEKEDSFVSADIDPAGLVGSMPLALGVIEMVFEDNGSIDFFFRYCNQSFEEMRGSKLEQISGKPFYSVFPSADKKWVVVHSDVAINGNVRTVKVYSHDMKKHLRVYCYQPKPGFCASILTEVNDSREE